MSVQNEILKMCFDTKYICGGDMYQILNTENGNNLIKRIDPDKKIKTKSTLTFKRNIISSQELFLYHLDKFIFYFRSRFFINPALIIMTISTMLESKYVDNFLFTEQFYDDNLTMEFEVYFWQTILDRFYNNLKIVNSDRDISKVLKNHNIYIDKINFNNKDDLKILFNFFIYFVNNSKIHISNFLIDISKSNYKEKNSLLDYWYVDLNDFI